MSTNYEPTKEQVDRETKEMLARWMSQSQDIFGWTRGEVVRILKRQHEREAGLLDVLQRIASGYDTSARLASETLAAHYALDAPSEPTLLEAAKEMLARKTHPFHCVAVDAKAFTALKAAVERQEARK